MIVVKLTYFQIVLGPSFVFSSVLQFNLYIVQPYQVVIFASFVTCRKCFQDSSHYKHILHCLLNGHLKGQLIPASVYTWMTHSDIASLHHTLNFSEHLHVRYCIRPLTLNSWIITRTIAMWNRWIRLLCYCNRVLNTCPLYKRVTPILQCVSPCNLFVSVWSMFVYNRRTWCTNSAEHTYTR